jgi:hypothetical protein
MLHCDSHVSLSRNEESFVRLADYQHLATNGRRARVCCALLIESAINAYAPFA